MTPTLEPIRKLRGSDATEAFDCGQSALNQFLQRYAWINQRANSAQTYVCCQAEQVVGYYSLTVASVGHQDAPERIVQGLARYPVPVMLLARLAVDRNCQGQGMGKALLKNAILRTMQAAEIAGIRALLTHAKDDAARRWYESWDFQPSPTDPYHLYVMIKDLKALVP